MTISLFQQIAKQKCQFCLSGIYIKYGKKSLPIFDFFNKIPNSRYALEMKSDILCIMLSIEV